MAKVSQLNYWLVNGDYNKIKEVVNQSENENNEYGLCEDPDLGLDVRIICHNIIASMYSYEDNIELSDYHMQRLQELFDQKVQLEQLQGQ